MNVKEILNEEKFPEAGVQGKKVYTIYVNPTPGEISKAAVEGEYGDYKGEVRFITDEEKKKLYVFSAFLTHMAACKIIGLPYVPNKNLRFGLVYGIGTGRKGIIDVKGQRLPRGYKKQLIEFLAANEKFKEVVRV